jgi:hypothetical protein
MSITPAQPTPLSVDYTSRDFYSLRQDLIERVQSRVNGNAGYNWTASDPADFGVALIEAFAYLGDVTAYYTDRIANENYISTAIQRKNILNIAAQYGYRPVGYSQAYTNLTFTNTSASIVTIPAGTVVYGSILTGDKLDIATTIYFSTLYEITVPAKVGASPGSETVSAAEGITISNLNGETTAYGELLGSSSGLPEQDFVLDEVPVVDGSVTVYVKEGDDWSAWTEVLHIIDYGPTDMVYTTTLSADDTVIISFGDGQSGKIPTIYSELRAVYTVGGGAQGNVPAGTIDTLHIIPGLSESQVAAASAYLTVANLEVALGGGDAESNDGIRQDAPQSIRALNRAVTLEDFESLAITSGAGKAKAKASTWSSVTLYISPPRTATDTDQSPGLDSAGDPSYEWNILKSEVLDFITPKVLIGTSLTISPPVYVDCVINLQYTKTNQYTDSQVEANIKKDLLSAFGYNGMDFKDTIYPQDIEFVLQQTKGVKTVKVLDLHRQGGSGLNTLIGLEYEIFRFKEENTSIGIM